MYREKLARRRFTRRGKLLFLRNPYQKIEFPVQEGEVSLYDSLLSSNPKPRETEGADVDETVGNRKHLVDEKHRPVDCGLWVENFFISITQDK